MPRVAHLKSPQEWQSTLDNSRSFGGKGVVVDFTATWCGPCKMIAPYFEELSDQYPNVTFVKVDVDELSDVAGSCGVRAMPTFQAYFNGEKFDELVGADKTKLNNMIKALEGRGSSSAGGPGRKLGGDAASPAAGGDSSDDRRARMAAAAEARMKGAQ